MPTESLAPVRTALRQLTPLKPRCAVWCTSVLEPATVTYSCRMIMSLCLMMMSVCYVMSRMLVMRRVHVQHVKLYTRHASPSDQVLVLEAPLR